MLRKLLYYMIALLTEWLLGLTLALALHWWCSLVCYQLTNQGDRILISHVERILFRECNLAVTLQNVQGYQRAIRKLNREWVVIFLPTRLLDNLMYLEALGILEQECRSEQDLDSPG